MFLCCCFCTGTWIQHLKTFFIKSMHGAVGKFGSHQIHPVKPEPRKHDFHLQIILRYIIRLVHYPHRKECLVVKLDLKL